MRSTLTHIQTHPRFFFAAAQRVWLKGEQWEKEAETALIFDDNDAVYDDNNTIRNVDVDVVFVVVVVVFVLVDIAAAAPLLSVVNELASGVASASALSSPHLLH
jgi:hypothetical protein